MKKVSLLLGTLGGAMAAYILSNEKLRHELTHAKDAETAAKSLGSHLAKDGKKLAKEVKTFVESDDVQKNFRKAKHFAAVKLTEAQHQFRKMVKQGGTAASSAVRNATKSKKMKVKRRAV